MFVNTFSVIICGFAIVSGHLPSNINFDSTETQDVTSKLNDDVTRSYLTQKMAEIELMLKQANVRASDFETQKDDLEIRTINFSFDQLARRADAEVAILEAFEKTNVLVDDNLLRVHDHDGYSSIEFEEILPFIDGFRIIKSTSFHNKTFIAIAFENHFELFSARSTSSWIDLEPVQMITNEQHTPQALEFIHLGDQLNMVVAFGDEAGGAVNSIVYEWTGSHMDEIHILPTVGAVNLAVVVKADSYLLAIAESRPKVEKYQVSIYQMKDGRFTSQKIATQAIMGLYFYEDYHDQAEDYLLVLDDKGEATGYRFEGEIFIKKFKTKLSKAPQAATIAYLEAVPVLFSGIGNNITLHKLSPEGLTFEAILPVRGIVSKLEVFEPKNGRYQVVAVSQETRALITVANLAVRRSIVVSPRAVEEEDDCFERLEKDLATKQLIIDQIGAKLRSLELIDDVTQNGVLKLDHEITLTSSRIGRLAVNTVQPLIMTDKQMADFGSNAAEKIKSIETKLPKLAYKNKPIEIDNPVTIQGDLSVKFLKADAINTNLVNEMEFTKSNFLEEGKSITLEQESGVLKELIVEDLNAPNIFLEGILMDPAFVTLTANNIRLPVDKKINDIDLQDVVYKDFEGVVEGEKTFENLQAQNIVVENIGDVNMQELLTNPRKLRNFSTKGNVDIDNLTVKTVNGIKFEEFVSQVFLNDVHDSLKGNLRVNGEAYIEELETKTFQGIKSEKLLTKTTDQVVSGNLIAEEISFDIAKVGLVNGLELNKDIAITTQNNVYVKSPVTISNLVVDNDLILNCNANPHKFCDLVDVRPEDLLQVYEGPVYINGSIILGDLDFGANAVMTINGDSFSTDMDSIFWMKSKSQEIPNSITFNAGIVTNHMDTANINGLPVENYLTVNSDFSSVPVQMKEIHLDGNLEVNPQTACADVTKLAQDIVTKEGSYTIIGKKTFHGSVTAKNAEIAQINDLNTDDIVLLDEYRDKTFTGNLIIDKLEVTGDLHLACDLESKLVNKFPLQKLVEKAAKINEDITFDTVTFTKSIQVEKLLISKGPFAEKIKSIDETYDGINLTIHGDLISEGGLSQVKTTNNIDFDSYIGQVVNKDIGGVIGGKKTFIKGLRVDGVLGTKTLNGIIVDDLMKKALRKSGNQIITGKQIIKHLATDKLSATYLNNLAIENIVNTVESPIIINSSLVLEDAIIYGQLNAKTSFDVKEFLEATNGVKASCWDEVRVNGVDWKEGGAVQSILDYGVHGYHENAVTGSVKFAADIEIESLLTNEYVSGVDVNHIANDAVYKSSQTQEISGRKTFKGETKIKELYLEEGFYAKDMPGLTLDRLNATLARVYADNVFLGQVTFTGNITSGSIKTQNINTTPLLNDIATTNDLQPLRRLEVDTIQVLGDLALKDINGDKFDNLQESIVFLDRPSHVQGYVEFEKVNIENLMTEELNGINITKKMPSSPVESSYGDYTQ